MKKISNILIAGILSACFILLNAGCTKILDKQTPTSSISNAIFWKTSNDAESVLTGMYIKLRNQTNQNIFMLGEGRSETLDRGTAGTLQYETYYENTLTSFSAALVNWGDLYNIINHANLLLKYVPTITFPSEAAKKQVMAQAYTMRAFTYFVLTRTWGAVPIRKEPIEEYDPANIQVERSPQAEVFALIKADLNTGIEMFSSNDFPAGRNRWSKPSAYALKADVYLWTGKLLNGGPADFTTALEACNAVQTSDVLLQPNFGDIFRYTNKGNKEVMMAVLYDASIPTADNFPRYGSISQVSFASLNVSQATLAAVGSPPGENSVYTPSATVRSQFSIDDQRRNATFLELFQRDATGTVSTYNTSIINKGRGTVINGVRFFADDVVLYRYADVLTMKAEAKNALGQDPSTEMNMVRQRAYGTNFAANAFVAGSKAQNDDAILKERLLELAFEGKRWWDLVRFGKVFELVPEYKGQAPNANVLVFPIHADVIGRETLIKQNTGWQ
ncbi:MAG: RagB/SusD family nutrient uptake outer membrane protein [Chitinophagaceae bacterium]